MRLAMLAVLALGAAGCSGIHQSGSVSPMDFFLPGAGHLMKANPPATNAPGLFPEISTEMASVK
jgi:hypothetical protein